MIMYASMLLGAARRAGMKTPPDGSPLVAMGAVGVVNVDVGFSPYEYPHFYVFCQTQLWRSVKWGEHWHNGEVIAEIPITHIRQVDLKELMRRGLEYGP